MKQHPVGTVGNECATRVWKGCNARLIFLRNQSNGNVTFFYYKIVTEPKPVKTDYFS